MIKNERQYRITKSQADKFDQSLLQLVASSEAAQMHPIERQIHQDALRSQLDDLRAQLAEYNALRSGVQNVLEVASFSNLPRALIQARIAAGFSQKELAERLGLKEQQIQQYESTEYASASISRVQEVIKSLGIFVREEVFLPSAGVSKSKLFQRLQSVGVSKELILTRILPRPLAARLQHEAKNDSDNLGSVVLEAASAVGRVFNLAPAVIFGSAPLQLSNTALGTVRFKVPAKVDERKMSAYTVYAHYLALLTLEATQQLEPKNVPTDPLEVRRNIVSDTKMLTFENALRYIWSLGIPVLPLADSGSFHGACWRIRGRNVIVVKQGMHHPSRWLNDALHELAHAGQKPDEEERSVVEIEDILRNQQNSQEEEDARNYAEDVIFGGRAEEIADKCYSRIKYIDELSRVVPQVAAEEGVPTGALANYVAFSLSLGHKNWWPAATNLQEKTPDPWVVARDVFMEYVNFNFLNEADRVLLLQSLVGLSEEA